MNRHEQFFRNTTAYLLEKDFKGNKIAYENYVKEKLPFVLRVMEKYAKDGNEWWLNTDIKMAYYQMREPILLVHLDDFEKVVVSVIGKESLNTMGFDPEKLSKAFDKALKEQNKSIVTKEQEKTI